MPFFSIIIPIYNVAPYLRECLDSVLNQTFADWEAICVDDGSSDGSGDILDEYAAKDSRFRVIHQKNAGVSAARNVALTILSGKWFLFLDGDDLLRNDALGILVQYCNDSCDGVLVQPYIPWWDGKEIPPRKIETRLLEQNASARDLIYGEYAANGFPFSRIYRRAIFEVIRFHEGVKMAEDVMFWFDALTLPARWTIINAEYYLYRQHSNSVCGKRNPLDCAAIFESVLYAFSTIETRLGLGTDGKRKYYERFPWSPIERMRIFLERYKLLSKSERQKLYSLVDKVILQLGYNPFPKNMWRRFLWIRAGLGSVFSCFDFCTWRIHRVYKLLSYIVSNGPKFACKKAMRYLLKQGEYSKQN